VTSNRNSAGWTDKAKGCLNDLANHFSRPEELSEGIKLNAASEDVRKALLKVEGIRTLDL
jgi:hypothetical protein